MNDTHNLLRPTAGACAAALGRGQFAYIALLVTIWSAPICEAGQTNGSKTLAGTSFTNFTRNADSPYYVEPDPTGTWVGSVTSQADGVVNADLARTMFGVDGSGIKIGVISDSFNSLGGAAVGILSGDLPGALNPLGHTTAVHVLQDDHGSSRIDEGRAMMELIHDIAPGAELYFHSAFNSFQSSPGGSIAAAIDDLRTAGVDIIVDDVFDLSMPIFQDGASAQAVDNAFAAGIAYFSAAGNSGSNSYEGTFQGTGLANPVTGFGDNAHDFGGGDTILNLGMLQPGAQARATLWWDDPYPTVGGTPTADIDFGIVDLTNPDNPNVPAIAQLSVADQLNAFFPADGFEFVNIANPFSTPIEVGLFVDGFAGDLNKTLKILVNGLQISDPNDTNSPTLFGHNAAQGAVAVAAQRYNNPPGTAVEFFSSGGPTTILFDPAGNRLAAPEIRATPELTGIDGTDTSFFPPSPLAQNDIEFNGFPNFFGTSAAAPHVAAIAALVLERAADLGVSLTPEQLYQLLFSSTVDLEAPGFDNESGYGRLDAKLALSAVVPEPGSLVPIAIGCMTLVGGRSGRHGARVFLG